MGHVGFEALMCSNTSIHYDTFSFRALWIIHSSHISLPRLFVLDFFPTEMVLRMKGQGIVLSN